MQENCEVPASQTALFRSDILEEIFGHCQSADLASSARVCQAWFLESISILWRGNIELETVLKILAPMEAVIQNQLGDPQFSQSFVRPIEPGDWGRFLIYAIRVRDVRHDANKIGLGVFEEIARTRPRMDIIPHLRRLAWFDPSSLPFSILFMHEGLENLKLGSLEGFPVTGVRSLFTTTLSRAPHLQELHLPTGDSGPMADAEPHLATMLAGLRSLRAVAIPPSYMTTRTLVALSVIPNLQHITCRSNHWQWQAQPSLDTQIAFDGANTLPSTAFPALQDVDLLLPYSDCGTLLSSAFFCPTITHISFRAEQSESSRTIKKIIKLLSVHFPSLRSIRLQSSSNDDGTFGSIVLPRDEPPITVDTLRPLTKVSSLEVLSIEHHLPAILAGGDLEFLVSHWRGLTEFSLTPRPRRGLGVSFLTLDALITFSKYCPKLAHLGLFLDASLSTPRLDYRSPRWGLRTTPALSSLRTLDVGRSNVGDDENLALCLSRLLSLKCTLWYEVALSIELSAPQDALATLLERSKRWSSVARMLRLCLMVRSEEREMRNVKTKRKAKKKDESVEV